MVLARPLPESFLEDISFSVFLAGQACKCLETADLE
jgi:hypothetical protein